MADDRIHTAHQARSREKERAIAQALRSLLRDKPFPDITVAEIANTAGVSVGGFYARYRSKQALLDVVALGVLDEFATIAAEHLRDPGPTVHDIARAYARLLVQNFRTRRPEIMQVLQYARNNSEAQNLLRQFNTAVHDRMRSLLRPHASERTVNLALFFSGAAAREAILLRNIQMYPLDLTDGELANEIAAAFVAYVERGDSGRADRAPTSSDA